MTGRVADIWRHPIKSHGREALDGIHLIKGRTMPWDRTWAVAHEGSGADGTIWAPCGNFSRVAKAPALQAVSASFEEATGLITLTHPERPAITFDPDQATDDFLNWVAPLMPADRPASVRIVRVNDRGMTDTDYPSISLNNLASNDAVARHLGTPVEPERWRGNIWFAGLQPWEEFDWVGKKLRLGSVEMFIQEPIVRCLATTANPATGKRDADTLGALKNGWGHQKFGVYAKVVKSGDIVMGDRAKVVS